MENGPLRIEDNGKVSLNKDGWFQSSNLLFGKLRTRGGGGEI